MTSPSACASASAFRNSAFADAAATFDCEMRSLRSFIPAAASSFKVASTLRSVSPSERRRSMSSAVRSNDSWRSAISRSNFRFAFASATLMRRSAVASASASRPSRSAIFSRSLSFFDFS